MKRHVLGVAVLALSAAGCSVSTARFNDGAGVGGEVVGSIAAPPPAPAAPASSPAMGAFLQGPIGQRLSDADRDRAYQAEIEALQSGNRNTWRGVKGNFGYVAPEADVRPDGCRGFSHTIYIGGRPQTGTGTGCRAPDGAWTVTG